MEVQHLYVHVPFCLAKCGYCGFFSVPYRADLAQAYLARLTADLDALQRGMADGCETVYVGGGTPSVLTAAELDGLLRRVGRVAGGSGLREWTVEVNPGTLDERKVRCLRDAGVTRVSVGAQSFDDTVLRAAGRRHTADDTRRTVALLRAAGLERIGLDLIAGLPGCTQGQFEATLDAALAEGPDHVSVYLLSIEPDSVFARTGRSCHGEDEEIALMDCAIERLAADGLARYEISNFARPGHECLHNMRFWEGYDYIGVGPAAVSRQGRRRRTEPADIAAWSAGAAADEETLLPWKDATERLTVGLRLTAGICPDCLLGRMEPGLAGALRKAWLATATSLQTDGLLRIDGARWRLTPDGLWVADYVAERFWVEMPDTDA